MPAIVTTFESILSQSQLSGAGVSPVHATGTNHASERSDEHSVPLVRTAGTAAPVPRGVFDLVLRDQVRLSAELMNEEALPEMTQNLLLLSLAGFSVHGLVMAITANAFSALFAFPL